MAELVLTDVENAVLHQLQLRAARHQRTPAEEANAILSETLHCKGSGPWAPVDAIYHRLAASGRTFSDSADLLRGDRDRCFEVAHFGRTRPRRACSVGR